MLNEISAAGATPGGLFPFHHMFALNNNFGEAAVSSNPTTSGSASTTPTAAATSGSGTGPGAFDVAR